jgi:hypothetical protein
VTGVPKVSVLSIPSGNKVPPHTEVVPSTSWQHAPLSLVRRPTHRWYQSHELFPSQHRNRRRQGLPQINEGECFGPEPVNQFVELKFPQLKSGDVKPDYITRAYTDDVFEMISVLLMCC